MTDETILNILTKLDISATGFYDNHFYIINLKDSDEYARTYTKLCKNAINTEYPNFDTTSKITNYFEIDESGNTYLIFLIANFAVDKYYLKIGGL